MTVLGCLVMLGYGALIGVWLHWGWCLMVGYPRRRESEHKQDVQVVAPLTGYPVHGVVRRVCFEEWRT